jgi:3-oxoadipate enol-lactonase
MTAPPPIVLDPHRLERPDATIRYWSGGAAGAPTVVLLHGATLDHRAWAPQIEVLCHRFRLVAPDLRGHGESGGVFDFEAAVGDVVALVEELAAPCVVLVGLSLGGNIAQEVVRRRPDLAHALVVADATCNTATRHPLVASMTIGLLNTQAMLLGDGFGRHAAQYTALDPDVRAYVQAVNAHRTNAQTVAILAALLNGALQPDPDYSTPVPLLLVCGDRDQVGDIAASTAAWARREPQAEYAVIPGAGHASNLDNPDGFTEVLVGFLDRVLPPSELGADRPARPARNRRLRRGRRLPRPRMGRRAA